MSTMAKIFVVVNLVLAVAVFGAAATLLGAQDDYKKALEMAAEKARATLDQKDREIQGLTKQANEALQRASEAGAARKTAEAETEQRKNEAAQSKAANEKLLASNEIYAAELAALRDLIEKNEAASKTLVNEAAQATKDKLNFQTRFEEETRARAQCEQTISDLQEQVNELAAMKGDLEKKVAELQFDVDQAAAQGYTRVAPGRGAEGVVNAVKGNLVTISVGSEDGVRRGDTYNVRRGGTYVGQIKITSVQKHLAVGEFDTQFPGPGGAPEVNDTAYPPGK
jgi:hypothetical protein